MDAQTPECPKHPPWPAWATCIRCGGLICDECLRRSGLIDIAESGQCLKCERTMPQPIAIGGWLPLIGLQLGGPLDAFTPLFNVVKIVAFTGPWMVYLARAKRVTQTFVVP